MRHVLTSAALACAVAWGATSAFAETTAPTDDELAAWLNAYAEIAAMEPKWAVQGAEAFKAMGDAGVPVVYLDVRTAEEWEKGTITDAVTVTLTDLASADGRAMLPESETAIIAVYCKSGHRSALAVPLLHRLGYANAISMKGGYEGWVEAGYPVTAVTQ